MQSRIGMSTKVKYTCFFRGARGETGGVSHAEKVESPVKNLKKPVRINDSNIVNDPVESQDVKDFVETHAKRALEGDDLEKKQYAGEETKQSPRTTADKKLTSKEHHSPGVQKLSLYEKIAVEMRSKTVRDEINAYVKMAKTHKRIEQNIGVALISKKNDNQSEP